ncbi:cell envelope integrity protein TolA [Falsiphaeobacter marinintestinus]|uniref:cell envelope integrity protein TolA n=1 Tax=Falsiphaeobacter marinintestinus TaxID=1492905 RepID=UPI001FE9B276|nr:TonB family protein [Phaeobacter marinintestinus]
MKHWAELLVFASVAVAIHIAIFATATESGSDAGGTGGDTIVTIAAAPPTVLEMVKRWDQPVQTHPVLDADLSQSDNSTSAVPTSPAMDLARAPRAEVQLALTRPEDDQLEDVETQPTSSPVQTPKTTVDPLDSQQLSQPKRPNAPELNQVERPKAPQKPTQMAVMRPVQTQIPEIETTPAAPVPTPKPKPKAKPVAKAKPTQKNPTSATKAEQNSSQSTAQKAAGSEGGTQAGTTNSATTSTLSKGQQAKLKAIWGSKIRSRIERRKRFPPGVNGSGQVAVRLTVSRDGRLLDVRVSKSSGVAAFDQAALKAVKSAGKFPKAPKKLPGDRFTLDLPLKFTK